MRFIITAKAKSVYQIRDQWYVHFDGSHEAICLGSDKPFETGDLVKITFEKAPDDLPS